MSTVQRRSHSKEPQPLPMGADRVASAAKTVNAAVNDAASRVGLVDLVEKSPYAVAAAALAVGYIAGGGLFTRTTVRLVELGAQLSTLPVIRNRFFEVAERAVDAVIDQATRLNDR